MLWPTTVFCLVHTILSVLGASYNTSTGEKTRERKFNSPQLEAQPSQQFITYPQGPPLTGCGVYPDVCPISRYRSIDGSCNNLLSPWLGTANSPYNRLLPPRYADGIKAPTIALSGNQLPSARTVSMALYPDALVVDPVFTLNVMQFGQFVAHDHSLNAGSLFALTRSGRTLCCSAEGQMLESAASMEECFPIIIPNNDPVYSPNNINCMNVIRTITTRDRGCVGGPQPAEQLTEITHFLDLSQVYGSTIEVHQQVRLFERGLLRADIRGGQQWLPRPMNASDVCDMQGMDEACYFAGDARVNQNPQLGVLQTSFLREHNRIAYILGQLNPHWDDELIFQETRKINIAQYQQITYYEWLPILLGDNFMHGGHGFDNSYNENVNPTVLNEHSTAANRYFHTLIMGQLHLVTESRDIGGALRLSDWFNRPQVVEEGNNFDNLARGVNTQHMHGADAFHDSEITLYLFRRQQLLGGDLKAVDIQRNRDHGLASYNDYRQYCGLPRATCFEDFVDVMSSENVEKLAFLYECPDDVELTVGGSLESHVPGALAGPTFLCILKEQFYRTRAGDRFWFENEGVTGFSLHQLYEIRKASISKILCNNGFDIKFMQPRGFEQISGGNAIVPCHELPEMDLTLWKETPIALTNVY